MSTALRILVVNAGSSSLKLRLLDADDRLLGEANLPAGERGFDAGAVASTLADWPAADVVGHRVVHGGERFREAVRIDDEVEHELRALTALAPLHQPKSLAGIDAARAALPGVPEVACFDTAFHATLPPAAYTYAVPAEWAARHGVRRYGFHGLSHAYAARRAGELLGGVPARLVVCHLGAGASLCAVADGRSVDTTMGFTPLEGLVMATRSGSIDPGLVLWLEEHERLTPHEVADALEHRSGLRALAGTADFRELERALAAGSERARRAFDVLLRSVTAHVAAMAAALQGLDAIVFTGGIGEHSALLRRAVAQRLGWLGVRLDTARNREVRGDADVTAPEAVVRTLVVAAREDLQIAAETRALLGG